ncbi:AmmeMemoRadiSam system protein A [Acidaminococcus sp. NSJ-142]|uniref:AmmeMemoRadiSam system protein A n=1 Tax=Acidaminococcus hominis TaxID=2897706 RepID=UPI001E2E30FF|nr:AmmeMemoRadiSam system protein A [Acidaminococcus hominis]MCD2434538.1 AmmeMemoRadiSam system protein A [Acidaminococcus hominis]
MPILAAFAVPHPPIILPEVGRGEEKKIQKTIDAYETVMAQAAQLQPDTLIITSPHAELYLDYFHITPDATGSGNFAAFRAPQVTVQVTYDQQLAKEISRQAEARGVPAGPLGARQAELDHGTLIPLYFYRQHGSLDQVKIVRIGLSGLPAKAHYALGQAIAAAVNHLGRRAVYIASGDLSHKLLAEGPYGFAQEGPVFDQSCTEALGKGDFLTLLSLDHHLCERAAECGLRSFWIMAGALDGLAVKSQLLSHEGPFGVGYGVASFFPQGKDKSREFLPQLLQEEAAARLLRQSQEDPYVKLARRSVETFVKEHQPASLPEGLPPEMLNQRAGVFVTLHKDNQLRGCIGTISPVQENIAREILSNGISAASRDPRFTPVRPEELPDLEYSVDVLGEKEPIPDTSYLDPSTYGVIVGSALDERRGLLLPDLDGVDTPEKQVAIARQKGQIGASEPIKLWRFKVVRHL